MKNKPSLINVRSCLECVEFAMKTHCQSIFQRFNIFITKTTNFISLLVSEKNTFYWHNELKYFYICSRLVEIRTTFEKISAPLSIHILTKVRYMSGHRNTKTMIRAYFRAKENQLVVRQMNVSQLSQNWPKRFTMVLDVGLEAWICVSMVFVG